MRGWIALFPLLVGLAEACVGENPTADADTLGADASSDVMPGADSAADAMAAADTNAGDAPSTGPCDPADPFGPPSVLSELIGPGWELGARLSPGGETVFFGRSDTVGAPRDLWQASRASASGPFGNASAIAALNSAAEEGKPAFPSSLAKVYFHSNRVSDGGAVYAIFRATFDTANGWGAPVALPDPVNPDGTSNQDVFVSLDDTEIFFSSNRVSGTPAIWRLPKDANDVFDVPEKIEAASAAPFVNSPVLSADGLRLYVGHGDAVPAVDTSVWMSSRSSRTASFEPAVKVGGVDLDVPGFRDEPSWISADECTLYLYSNRAGNNFRVYRAERQRR